uniref:Uncharacterized protein n=1 Tax=Arundo donax TaxID=35708 RepID=A0A0A9DRE4_ARUDO
METPRLVVGAAALRAPPPSPPLRHRRFPPPRGAAHRLLFAGAPRPTSLTRCSYSRKAKGDSRGKPRRQSSSTVRLDVQANSDQLFQGPNLFDGQRKADIWELFSEAQRNILYLNKKRLVAMEELKKLQEENKLLLQDIEVLEMEAQGVPLEAAQSSSFCELLLRIDTMAVSGMISTTEASDLRKKIVDNRSTIQSAFSDIHHKPNTELLTELRLFLHKPIEYATTYLRVLQLYYSRHCIQSFYRTIQPVCWHHLTSTSVNLNMHVYMATHTCSTLVFHPETSSCCAHLH